MLTSRLARLTLSAFALAAVGAAHAAAPGPDYVSSPAHSTLTYTFTQAGAANHGVFKSFSVQFDPRAKTLEVVIDMRSFDTHDAQRNALLAGAQFFDVARYPQARFTATQLHKTPSGYIATGPLTLRGITRTVSVPFTWRLLGRSGGELQGKTVIERLAFGIGQGEWHATEWLGNPVTVRFALRMVPATH
ncbi:MAG: YceI family protein [Pseudomonadota bacterium]|jgi:polyisoprenoid-binding protein YceI|nr:YceI family protein [Pseudomonadota bacterium]